MAKFLKEQFARGKRELSGDTLQAVFALAGESPNDQQQLAYHFVDAIDLPKTPV
jgi:hypothetical protein